MSDPDFPRPVTQREIATALGVSIAAVSLALKNSPELSEAKRREIQEFADRMGYRPNSAAAELASYKRVSVNQPITATLAWINTWRPASKLRSYRHFDAYWIGAEASAAKLGYRLEEFQLESGLHPNRLHEILQARGIRGIMLPPQREDPHWGNFPWDCYSVVRFGQSMRYPACHIVSSDQVGNAMRAFQMIRLKGYRRIGFLTNEVEMVRKGGHLFEAGFLMAQRLVGEEERVSVCVVTDPNNSARVSKMVTWMEEQGVDAIFTDIAEVPSILSSIGLRVPEDIGLAVTNVADIAVPAGIHQHPLEIGKVGAFLLHSLITNNERGIPAIPRQVLVDGTWVDGASLPDLNPVEDGQSNKAPAI
jgi:LacI family transcriptional regulator